VLQEFELGRRALLGHALVLAGAVSTAGFSAEALAKAAAKPKRYLAKSPFAALSALADTIVPVTETPGALAANVPALVDALLVNWASPETREAIGGSLARLDATAQAQHGKTFAALTAAERAAFLTDYDKAALKPVPPPPGAKSANPFAPTVYVIDPGYLRVKGLIIALYYSSEIGLTQELIYEHVPGTWQPSIKLEPGMRPFAGTGPF
jgi:gluconate 2-dehydrogenase gamma chain